MEVELVELLRDGEDAVRDAANSAEIEGRVFGGFDLLGRQVDVGSALAVVGGRPGDSGVVDVGLTVGAHEGVDGGLGRGRCGGGGVRRARSGGLLAMQAPHQRTPQ